jgi:dihydroxyacetone kinase-like protein
MADSKKVLEIIRAIGLKMEAEKEYLTELDQPIGDSDHGINMARGFAAVEGKLPDLEGKDIGTILKTVGMTLVSTVGGASGPLYGSAYMKAGMALAGKEEMDMDDFLSMMDTAVQAVEQRGKATVEEATMLDAMVPSLKAMKDAAAEGKRPGSAGGRSQGSLGRRRAHQRSGSYQRPGQLCGREGTGASGSGSHLLFLYAGSHCGAGIETGIETDTGNRYRIQNRA